MSENLFWGVLVITVCTAGYIFAFKKQKQDNYTIALMLLLLCGFSLRIYTALDANLHAWDERYHALVAKHLLNHLLRPTLYENPVLPFDYMNFKTAGIWVHKQPLPLWLIALSLKIFGLHPWVVRLPSVILSTIGIKLTYDLAKFLYSKNVAFVAAFLFSINGLILDLASGRTATDHVDVAFLFFVLLSVWCGMNNVKKQSYSWAALTGICMGCAILCKWLPALIVLPIWTLITYKNNKSIKTFVINLLIILVTGILVSLPWQLYILHNFPTETLFEYRYNAQHIHEVLAGQGGNWFYHFNMLRMNFGEFVYIPIVCFSIAVIRKRKAYDTAIFIWFWIPYLFFSFCATKMQAYTIFAAPAIFIIIANQFYFFLDLYKERKEWRWLYAVIAYGLLLLPVRYTIERAKPFSNDYDRDPKWERNINNFKQSPLNTPKTVVLNCEHAIEMMFETKCIAYQQLPGPSAIADLKAKGYNVIIWKQE